MQLIYSAYLRFVFDIFDVVTLSILQTLTIYHMYRQRSNTASTNTAQQAKAEVRMAINAAILSILQLLSRLGDMAISSFMPLYASLLSYRNLLTFLIVSVQFLEDINRVIDAPLLLILSKTARRMFKLFLRRKKYTVEVPVINRNNNRNNNQQVRGAQQQIVHHR